MESNDPPTQSAGQVFGRRVAEARKHQFLTQKQLVERVNELGYPDLSRSTLAKIESGDRRAERVPLIEVLVLAEALQVPPKLLLTSRDDELDVKLTDTLTIPAPEYRAWVHRGEPRPSHDKAKLLAELPADELEARFKEEFLRGEGRLGLLTRAFMEEKGLDQVAAAASIAAAASAEVRNPTDTRLFRRKKDASPNPDDTKGS